uniref:Leucine-rich repeat protein n=1 Tax=Marseillevirus LCMAC102 TaxID=2506603 RepID=A0A481YUG0_9VIRU|nr:MAG: hypothetical protein LCMAC102_03160 [Marseillevirus LCMAC102]
MTDYVTHESFRDMLWDCIVGLLNLEDVCCLLMTTKRLWNQRTKLDFKLREDTITIQQLKSIPGEWRNKIHTLNLSHTEIGDISVLSECKNLYSLNLSGNSIGDILALKNLNLHTLCLTYVTFNKTISGLDWWPSLQALDLCLSEIVDIDLPNLHTLDLCHSKGIHKNRKYTNVIDISTLGEYRNLYALIMSHTKIKNISILSERQSLYALCIEVEKVSDLSKFPIVCTQSY